MKNLLLLITIAFITLQSCKKDKETAPATHPQNALQKVLMGKSFYQVKSQVGNTIYTYSNVIMTYRNDSIILDNVYRHKIAYTQYVLDNVFHDAYSEKVEGLPAPDNYRYVLFEEIQNDTVLLKDYSNITLNYKTWLVLKR